MYFFEQALGDLKEAFINNESLSRRPEVVAIFLGGSRVYQAEDGLSQHPPRGDAQTPRDAPRDWDGAIIVKTKHDIFTLINDHRQDLMDLIGVAREECSESEFQVPSPSSPLWPEFDAVRLAGFGKSSEKRSMKIMSWEYFSQGKTSLNILSYKDKRVFRMTRTGPSGTSPFYQIKQATTLPNQSVIGHDQWVSRASGIGEGPIQDPTHAIFGVTADLLVSGACLVGREPYGLEIKRKLLAHYSIVTGQQVSFTTFARYSRFLPLYVEWLNQELGGLQPLCRIEAPPDSRLNDSSHGTATPLVSFCDTDGARAAAHQDFSGEPKTLPIEAYELFEKGLISQPRKEETPFASKWQKYTVTTYGSPETSTTIFCKQIPHAEDELRGATLATNYFPRIQVPRVSTSGVLLYPLFQGATEAETRQAYIQGGRTDYTAAGRVLYAELVKAEDTLRAYRKCLTSGEEKGVDPDYRLQRFYNKRLVNDTQLRKLYGPNLRLVGKSIPLDEFLGMRWRINGVDYPSLRELYDTALEIFDVSGPQIATCPVVFGLGDCHGGNIMLSPESTQHGSPETLLIDYEVAGFHPVMVDLAKPLYIDVFFESFCLDILSQDAQGDVNCEITGNTLAVDFVPITDWLSQAILDIKVRYLIRPLCEEIRRLNRSLEDYVPLLANALLLCATISGRRLNRESGSFLINFAIGIMFAGAKNWDDLYSCFERLGFKIPTESK